MNKPTKEQYTQYWVYQQGKVIDQGYGATPNKYKGYTIETKFYEEQYNKALSEYNQVYSGIKEAFKAERISLENTEFDIKLVELVKEIIEADTPTKAVKLVVKSMEKLVTLLDTKPKDYNIWNEITKMQQELTVAMEDFWK